MAFYVGQKVVCVDASPDLAGRPHDLREGNVYVIVGFYRSGVGVLVDKSKFNERCGYWPHRFRPVVERKTDISIFTAMLNPKQRETAER